IRSCMQSMINEEKYAPPRMIPAIVEGFNAVAEHIYVILFPVILDLLLWFGPSVRVKKFFLPLLLEASQMSAATYGDQAAELVEATREIWGTMLERFNLLFSLRTFPIGIPSLMVGYISDMTPFGDSMVIELEKGEMVLIWLLIYILTGFFLGSIYFTLTAGLVNGGQQSLKIKQVVSQMIQGFILTVILVCSMLLLAIPVSCLLSSIMLIIPSFGTFPVIFLGLLAVWLGLPLVFSPHGVYFGGQKAGRSIVTSIRLVRSLAARVGLFFIMLSVIGSGLDFLWMTPEANNWMLLVGIIGHAFVSTGLLAASFAYYGKGIKWLNKTVQLKENKKSIVVS
ncbi:MAG: hypothetical protein J7L66_05095, partial [Anaerolineaceae bacterium]|nr:hypothetical protein [Anaerolineaceae bacterium]